MLSVTLAAASVAFAIIVFLAMGSVAFASLDITIAEWFHERISLPGVRLMGLITRLGDSWFVVASTCALAAWFLKQGELFQAVESLFTVGGGILLAELLKLVFERTRPFFDDPVLMLTTYSFPSGHVAGTTVLFGFFFLLGARRLASGALKMVVGCGAALAIGMVGLSRMYLGAHYLGDVIGAMAMGVAWLSLCGIYFEIRRMRR